MKPKKLSAFTITYDRLVREVITDAKIASPIDSTMAPYDLKAIWDTGATSSVITETLARHLKLPVTGKVKVLGVNSSEIVNTYIVDIYLPNMVIIQGVTVTEAKNLGPGEIHLLIGMDIIRNGDFAITNKDLKTTFSFQMPSDQSIDFVPRAITINERHNRIAEEKKRALKNKRKCRKNK